MLKISTGHYWVVRLRDLNGSAIVDSSPEIAYLDCYLGSVDSVTLAGSYTVDASWVKIVGRVADTVLPLVGDYQNA